jgi:hypothetical protein
VTIAELVPGGKVRAQADMMRDILADPASTEMVLVTLAEELPTTETEETLAWLDTEKVVTRPTLVANRVLERLADSSTPPGPLGEAAQLHRALWAEQQAWLSHLPPQHTLPYLFGVFTPGEVAARMCDLFEGIT